MASVALSYIVLAMSLSLIVWSSGVIDKPVSRRRVDCVAQPSQLVGDDSAVLRKARALLVNRARKDLLSRTNGYFETVFKRS